MNEKIEAQGKTVDEAVSEALLRLGARRDEVDVTVLDEPKSGFLGIIGGRPAKVEVSRKRNSRRGQRRSQTKQQAHEFGDNPRTRKGRSGGRKNENQGNKPRTNQQGAARVPDAEPTQASGRKPRGEDGRQGEERSSRNRRPRQQRNNNQNNGQNSGQNTGQNTGQNAGQNNARNNGRNNSENSRPRRNHEQTTNNEQSPAVDSPAETQAQQPRQPRQPRRARNERRPRSDRQSQPERTERTERNPRQEERQPRAERVQNTTPDVAIVTGISAGKYAKPVRGIAPEELKSTLETMTTGLLVRAGFPSRCEVKDDEYQQVRVTTDDESAGMLIGRHGATIDSVEHLVERMISMAVGDRVKMNLDINNYRRRRHETLLERVEEAVATVRETGKTYHVEPLNARERRIVHLAVEKFDGLRTFTMDSHRGRHVIIALDNEGKEEPVTDEAGSVVESTPVEAVEAEATEQETTETDSIEVEIFEEESPRD